jgi:hypothetical protein
MGDGREDLCNAEETANMVGSYKLVYLNPYLDLGWVS